MHDITYFWLFLIDFPFLGADIADILGHKDTKVISDDNLAALVRQIAVNCDVGGFFTQFLLSFFTRKFGLSHICLNGTWILPVCCISISFSNQQWNFTQVEQNHFTNQERDTFHYSRYIQHHIKGRIETLILKDLFWRKWIDRFEFYQ